MYSLLPGSENLIWLPGSLHFQPMPAFDYKPPEGKEQVCVVLFIKDLLWI